MDYSGFFELASEAARAAGRLLIDHSRHPARGVTSKSTPTDPVSDADRASDALLQELISRARPDDGFITEESEGRGSRSGIDWVLDPLDGTVNFLFGIPWWCVSIAVEHDRETVAAAIYNPLLDELFGAVKGGGAWLNGAAIRVSDRAEVATALIGTGFSYDSEARRAQAEVAARILPVARDLRRAGSAALDLSSLACGRLDGFYEAPMEHWDKAAGILIVEEAGGVVTELRPPKRGLSPGVIAAGPRLHPALSELVLGGPS